MQGLPVLSGLLETTSIIGVGVVVGAASTWTGLGSGLALPLLTTLGVPLSGALLAVKLPVAFSDAAAGFCVPHQGEATPSGASLSASMLGAIALSGAMAAGLMLVCSPAWALAVALALAAAALAQRPSETRPEGRLWWAAYVGACGVGAGWLQRTQSRLHSGLWRSTERRRRQAGAAANFGAVVVLAGSGLSADSSVLTLALAQALGSWAAAAMACRRRQGRAVADLRHTALY